MSRSGSFLKWARARAQPRDLAPAVIGIWLMKTGVDKGNEMFIFIALYLFGLVPAWWADKGPPAPPDPSAGGPSAPPGPPAPEQGTLGGPEE